MADQLTLDVNQIDVSPGSITFNDFDTIKQEAIELSKHIEAVEVDDENVKESKRMLAAVNKRVKELEDKRISIKKQMLAPYQEFESQVKTIVSIVKDADAMVRDKVKQLEEEEREGKRQQIETLWDARIGQYEFGDLFSFEDFLRPKHLNKSTSMNTVEKEMVDWLEQRDQDIKFIKNQEQMDEILAEYQQTQDLSAAANAVQERNNRQQQVKQSVGSDDKKYIIYLYNKSEFEAAKKVLKDNEIYFYGKVDM